MGMNAASRGPEDCPSVIPVFSAWSQSLAMVAFGGFRSFSTLLTVSASSAESSMRSPSSLPESTIVTAPRSAGLS